MFLLPPTLVVIHSIRKLNMTMAGNLRADWRTFRLSIPRLHYNTTISI
nr:MAG TPA: hypothetical protein [Bacteriophage sp.]